MQDKPLKGIYRVSFELDVDSSDQISVSDVAQSLLEGFGEGLLECVSHLDVEKIEKHGKNEPKVFKIGDKVQLKESLTITADIYSDDGYIFVGSKNEISEIVTEEPASITVEAGSVGFVNKINKDGSVEIAELDKPYINPLWQDIGLDAINIDLISVNAEQLEKIEFQGEK